MSQANQILRPFVRHGLAEGLQFLNLSFLIRKMGLRLVPTSLSCFEN